MAVWHVVSNEEGLILAVYGQALLAAAQESARSIGYKTGCLTFLHTIEGNRPSVNGQISMKNVYQPGGPWPFAGESSACARQPFCVLQVSHAGPCSSTFLPAPKKEGTP